MTLPAIAALEAQLDQQLTTLEVPGVAVGMLLDGQEYVVCRGTTRADGGTAIDADTIFQVGSTTKTLTATAALRLVEEGLVGLDTPVRDTIPDLRLADEHVAAGVTLRHLLTHTGGWDCDVMASFGPGSDALTHYVEAMADVPQVAPMGWWGYQNSAFSLAGRMIEVATGMTYERAVHDLVLGRLGMEHSVFSAADAIVHRVAVGHHHGVSGAVVAIPWELDRPMNPAGGLASSVADQLRYARFHLGDGTSATGERLLSKAGLEQMRQPQADAGGGYAAKIGLGWLLQPTPGLIAHGGSTNGQESSFALVPDRGFAFTVLTNSQAGAILQRALTKWALREVAGLTPARLELVPANSSDRARCLGVFSGGAYSVTVDENADRLEMTVAPTAPLLEQIPGSPTFGPMPVTLYEGGRFRLADGEMRGATGEFLGDRAVAASHVRLNGRLHARAG